MLRASIASSSFTGLMSRMSERRLPDRPDGIRRIFIPRSSRERYVRENRSIHVHWEGVLGSGIAFAIVAFVAAVRGARGLCESVFRETSAHAVTPARSHVL